MDDEKVKTITKDVLVKKVLEKFSICYVPVAISNRHVHLSEAEVEKLFGKGYVLKPLKNLVQPGQFACEEKISVVGLKGTIDGVRVIGPPRKETQVEMSITDSYTLGINPVVRMSGELEGTPGCRLIGPAGESKMEKGVIVSQRHLHVSEEEAKNLGLKDGELVNITKRGARTLVFNDVVVRAGGGHKLEFHIDTDEGNAGGIKTGELLECEMFDFRSQNI